MRDRFGFAVGICNTCKSFVSIVFSYLLEGNFIKYGLDDFYNCRGYLLNQNIVLNKHRLNSAQKNFPRGMVNAKQPTVYLGYKHHLNMMVSCERSCMSTAFERADCFQAQIVRAKCIKCKESVFLGNTNLVETYLVHIDANKARVLCHFCDGKCSGNILNVYKKGLKWLDTLYLKINRYKIKPYFYTER